jgi:3D (Asp-Asp-Asp) domain-containing protein
MKIKLLASFILAGFLIYVTNLNVFATEERDIEGKHKDYYKPGITIEIQEKDDSYIMQSKALNISWTSEKVEAETLYTNQDVYITQLSPNVNNQRGVCLPLGTEVQRVGISENGWDLINYEDEIYFIWYDYLTNVEPIALNNPNNYAGTFELTAYEWTGNPCADGVYPEVNYTAACNDPALCHRWIYIEGYGIYYVHDTGGMASNVIDIYMGDYDSCIQFGRRSANIYFVD